MTYYGPVLLVMLVGGLLVGYVTLRNQMRQQIAELRGMLEAEKQRLQEIKSETTPVAKASETKSAPAPKHEPAPLTPVKQPAPAKEEITPEILAIVAAAVAQFVGAGARIRSTRMLAIPEGNAWAQQGRVIIQASHNLAMR
jgi:hypothetical protein